MEQDASGDMVRARPKEAFPTGRPYFISDFGPNYVSNLTYI